MSYFPKTFVEIKKFGSIIIPPGGTTNGMVDLNTCSHVVYSVKSNSQWATLTLTQPGNNYSNIHGKKATFINAGTLNFQMTLFGSWLRSGFVHPSGNIYFTPNQYVTIVFSDNGYAMSERSTIST